jgi:ATP-dependent Clp protease adaptor protein ClpS
MAEKVAQPEVVQRERVEQLPPYRVILHNDDVNTIDHVVLSIVQLTPLNAEVAVQKTLEAHEKGLSQLLVTHKERAELYCEQFASRNLTVTCEPA